MTCSWAAIPNTLIRLGAPPTLFVISTAKSPKWHSGPTHFPRRRFNRSSMRQALPSSTTLNAGQNLTIVSGIRGSGLTYQWYLNGVPVAGQTNATLSYASAGTTNAGNYYVVATNPYGKLTNSTIDVTIFGPPSVTQQTPTLLNIFAGSSPTLYATPDGATPIYYQWNVNG